MSVLLPSLCSIKTTIPSSRPVPGGAPRAAAVKDADANAAALAKPAQNVLDRASTALPLPGGTALRQCPAFFPLIIGGRSSRSTSESIVYPIPKSTEDPMNRRENGAGGAAWRRGLWTAVSGPQKSKGAARRTRGA